LKSLPPARPIFDADCRDCPRLAQFLESVRARYPQYYARPVPSFGPAKARLLIVGLAPGMHGANRTGRPFTGDHAGILLYRTLHEFGFASSAGSGDPLDGLELRECRISNALKCVPPANKPLPEEIRRCNHYLAAEIARVRPRAILALGRVAHEAVLLAAQLPPRRFAFAHGALHRLPGDESAVLFDSYHCSRYNTQTKRLTEEMFRAVLHDISRFLGRKQASGRVTKAEARQP
jgi:uracil-DNA glycosylase family 4